MNLFDCPVFDDDAYETVLDWAAAHHEAAIDYNDKFVKGDGEPVEMPELAHWALSWKHGHIGWDDLQRRHDEPQARKASALYIYLWSLGVPWGLAIRCARAYVDHVEVETL